MVLITKNGFLDGIPLFTDFNKKTQDLKTKSFKTENPLINRIKPSYEKSAIRQIFDKLIRFITSLFIATQPNLMKEKLVKIIRGGGSYSAQRNYTSFWELSSHYNRFIQSDRKCPPQLKRCLTQLEKDEAFIKSMQIKKTDLDLAIKNNDDAKDKYSSGYEKSSKLEKKLNAEKQKIKKNKNSLKNKSEIFSKKKIKEIRELPSNSSQLLLLQRDSSNPLIAQANLFLTISKNKAGLYSFRFMGTGSVMSNLAHDGKTFPLAGKNKVARELCFEKIPQKELQKHWLKTLIKKWSEEPSLSMEDVKMVTAALNDYKKESSSLNDLATCSERVDSLFWNVVRTCQNKPLSKVEEKRLKLRANILSLFDFFQEIRSELKPHTKDYQILSQTLEGISQNVYLAAKKNYLSQEEVKEINEELAVIEKALHKAKKCPISFPKKINKKKVSIKISSDFHKALHKMEKTSPVNNSDEELEMSPPSDEPVTMPNFKPISQQLYANLKSEKEFLKIFRNKCKAVASHSDSPLQQMVAVKDFQRLFYELPYHHFTKEQTKNVSSFWWSLSHEECNEIMTKINEFSEIFLKSKTDVSEYEYESLMRMTHLVSFLNSRTSGVWLDGFDPYQSKMFIPFGRRATYRTHTDEVPHAVQKRNDYVNCMKKEFRSIQVELSRRMISFRGEDGIPLNEYNTPSIKNNPLRWNVVQNELLLKYLFNKIDLRYSYLIEYASRFYTSVPELKNWLRPISDPHLQALRKIVETRADYSSLPGKDEDRIKCPEAYQREPENVFNLMHEQAQDLLNKCQIEQNNNQITPPAPTVFNTKEKQQLLHILRSQYPQIELIVFLKEFPHLMRNSDVRNYFDSLFFRSKDRSDEIFMFDPDRANNSETLIQLNHQAHIFKQLLQEIKSIKENIFKELQLKTIRDPKLLRQKLDALLYYYELTAKFRQLLINQKIPIDMIQLSPEEMNVSLTDLKKLRELCEKRPDLNGSLGYAIRIETMFLLECQPTNVSQIFKNFGLIKTKICDPANLDPYFDEALERYWQEVVKQCEKEKPNLNSFLDQLCHENGFPIDQSNWNYIKGVVYRNSSYEVNLKTCQVTKINSKRSLEFIPEAIRTNPLFISVLGKEKNWQAMAEIVEDKKIYALKDDHGHEIQIEQHLGQLSIFKKFEIDGGKWLQCLLPNQFFADSTSTHKVEETEAEKSSLPLYHPDNSSFINATNPLFANGIFIDPKSPTQIYCLDNQKEISFKLNFVKENGKHNETCICTSIVDYTSGDPIKFDQFSTAAHLKDAAIDQLTSFENKNNILLLEHKGCLKKIFFPRYNLSFVYNEGRLISNDPQYKDYSIDLSATLTEKKGLHHALVLAHSDPTKPKKLLIPQTDAIQTTLEKILPENSGIGKIVQHLRMMYDLFFKQRMPDVKLKLRQDIDPSKTSLTYSTLDVRPFTGEICSKEKVSPNAIFELTKQALILEKPALAKEMIDLLTINPKTLNKAFLNDLMDFITEKFVDDGAEAAIKIKLCFDIRKCLIDQKQLSKELNNQLNQLMRDFGTKFYATGRKIPKELQLSESLKFIMPMIFLNGDSDYYNAHLRANLLKNGEKFDLFNEHSIPEIVTDERIVKSNKKNKKHLFLPTTEQNIETLEKKISPTTCLEDSDLIYSITRADKEIPLIQFSKKQENFLFKKETTALPKLKLNHTSDMSKCEKIALKEAQKFVDKFRSEEKQRPRHLLKVDKKTLKKFIENKIVPQKIRREQKIAQIQHRIEEMVRQSDDPNEQIAILAGHQTICSFEELRQGLVQDNLKKLQERGRLPQSLDIEELKKLLVQFFETLSHRNAAAAAITLAEEIIKKGNQKNTAEWDALSEGLYRLLTNRRSYDTHKEPQLLVFEAQQFINFKPLEGGLDQIGLLDQLVKNPKGIIQAPTGAGKTSVLSVLRSLLKANGKNLSIQKVMPSLFAQTNEKLKNILGDLFGVSIYSLRFNLKKPLVITQTDPATQEEIAHSIFKDMYLNLLETMDKKGCVLTDYKSLPLLEETFFKICENLHQTKESGRPVNPVLEEHFTYLRKILILLNNKADENMDEFDQHNRPIIKIQLDLGIGSNKLPKTIIKTSMEIYEALIENRELKLLENIQGDLSQKTRTDAIQQTAEIFVAQIRNTAKDLKKEQLLEYLLGNSDAILPQLQTLPPELKDYIAVCKDQFSIYLPLTLGYKGGSRYARSDDGTKTVPCVNGEKHDAKFGTILEQVNYAIQDYYQNGITLTDLKPWIFESKAEWDDKTEGTQKNNLLKKFHKILPGYSFYQASQMVESKEGQKKLLQIINKDPKKVGHFLKRHLKSLKTSGQLITMDPQNVIDMSRAVSGVSATMGAPDSFHRNFVINSDLNGQIQASMLYRLNKRAEKEEVIQYDPEKPLEMLKETDDSTIQAIIDGAGAFKKPTEVANALCSQSQVKCVGYHHEDESIHYVGKETNDLSEEGFFYSQQHTRGTDIRLARNAKAILTLNAKDGIRDFCQKEGRLRLEGQSYVLAMPKQQNILTVNQEIIHAIAQDALVDAQDIFRKSKQELYAIMRKGKREQLLAKDNIDEFLELFKKPGYRDTFILQGQIHYENSGDYFAAHQHITKTDQTPLAVLDALKEKLIDEARELGLDATVKELEAIEYSKVLLKKMPKNVPPLGAAQGELENELQIEQEEECELEQENEMENEVENRKSETKATAFYPERLYDVPIHGLSDQINPAYNEKIMVTDNFLPFSRLGTTSPFKRAPFDEQMFRVGQIYFELKSKYNDEGGGRLHSIESVIIEDPLMDSYKHYACYDIRTNSIVHNPARDDYDGDIEKCLATPEGLEILAQIKFFDARVDGYREDEDANELEALKVWLIKNDARKMQKHFVEEILPHRKEASSFKESQLDQLFQSIIK